MNYIIFDLEWNNINGTKAFHSYYKKMSSKTMFFNEIIEIGAMKLNDNLEELDSFRIYIKPSIYKKLNPRITKLTGIKNEDLQYGMLFNKALKYLKKWMEKDYVLCSWSDSDIKVLKENIKYHIPTYKYESLIFPYVDIQKYYCCLFGHHNQIALEKAVCKENIQLSENIHQALNDSKLTVQIFKKFFHKEKIKDYVINNAEDLEKILYPQLVVEKGAKYEVDMKKIRAR